MRRTTLCYIEKDGAYLMLHRVKKENDVNHDKWIGVGGGIEPGETPEEGVCREIKEETGYDVTAPRPRGVLWFFPHPGEDEVIYLFTATAFSGSQIECNEGDLEWVKKEKVTDLPIWEGDRIFLDLLAREAPYFELRLYYEGDRLVKAILDGKTIRE